MLSNHTIKTIKIITILLFLLYTTMFNILNMDYYPLGIDYSVSNIGVINWYIIIGLILVFNNGYYKESIQSDKFNYIIRANSRRYYFIVIFLKHQCRGLFLSIAYICISSYKLYLDDTLFKFNKETIIIATLTFIISIFTVLSLQINIEVVANPLLSFLIVNILIFVMTSLPEIDIAIYKYICVFNFLSYKRIDDLQLFFVIISIMLMNIVLFLFYLKHNKNIDIV